jgi:hypothetical protein
MERSPDDDDEGRAEAPAPERLATPELSTIRARLQAIRERLANGRAHADESRRKLERAELAFSQAQTDVRSAEEVRVRHRDAKHAAKKVGR